MVKGFAKLGADVIIACRSMERGQAAKAEVESQLDGSHGSISVQPLDTSDSNSITEFAKAIIHQNICIDIMCHNAGTAIQSAKGNRYNADGQEIIYATNLLGSFQLTHDLLPLISRDARICFTSSFAGLDPHFSDTFESVSERHMEEPGFHYNVRDVGKSEKSKDESRYGNSKASQILLAALLQDKSDQAGLSWVVSSYK